MAVPGFDDPALASYPPAGNLYFASSSAVGELTPHAQQSIEPHGPGYAQAIDRTPPALMFGHGTATDGQGAAIANVADSHGKGHVSEILNFHGSPAPWILIGILLVAGLLHLSAGAHFKGAL